MRGFWTSPWVPPTESNPDSSTDSVRVKTVGGRSKKTHAAAACPKSHRSSSDSLGGLFGDPTNLVAAQVIVERKLNGEPHACKKARAWHRTRNSSSPGHFAGSLASTGSRVEEAIALRRLIRRPCKLHFFLP